MTRQFFFSIIFLLVAFMGSYCSQASGYKTQSEPIMHSKEIAMGNPVETANKDKAMQDAESAKKEEPVKKNHVINSEELAHIHRFHKERVKKMKRHHKKFWLLSKALLIVCHLMLLIGAFIHLVH